MKKKYLFVHIAKAAGSSVNKFFMDALGHERCAVHLESNPQWKTEEGRAEILMKHDYLSGHLELWNFRSKVNLDQFNVFTFLRDPREHVVSHLAWIRHLADPGQEKRFLEHPKYIQKLSKKLSLVNFSDKENILDFVENLTQEELSLLDNPQTRYLRSGRNCGPVSVNDVSDAVRYLKSMNAFGLVDRLSSDLEFIADLEGFCVTESVPKENIASQKYGMSLKDDDLFFALDKIIKFDIILYECAIQLKGRYIIESLDFSLDADEYIFNLDRISDRSIHGWVRLVGNKLVDSYFDVFVNCCYVGQFLANKNRPDLAKAFGLSCGFDFFLRRDKFIKNGDIVSIVDSKSKKIVKEVKFHNKI